MTKNLTKHSPKETKESKTNVKRSKTKWRRPLCWVICISTSPLCRPVASLVSRFGSLQTSFGSLVSPFSVSLHLPCWKEEWQKGLHPPGIPQRARNTEKQRNAQCCSLCAPLRLPFLRGRRGEGWGGLQNCMHPARPPRAGTRKKKTHRQRETRQSDTAVKRSETFWRRSPKSGSGPATPTCCHLHREETTSRPRRQELHRGVGAIWLGWWCVWSVCNRLIY